MAPIISDRGEWPGLAGEVAHVAHLDPGFLASSRATAASIDLARLDEAGQRRIAPRRILRLAAEQQPAVMLGEHDHDRIDARIMFGAARAAGARPAAAIGRGRLRRRPSRSGGGGASWRGSARRRRSARRAASSMAEQPEMRARRRPARRRRAGARSAALAVEPEEQRRLAGDLAPPQPPCSSSAGAPLPTPAAAHRRGGKRGDRLGSARRASARSRPAPAKRVRRQARLLCASTASAARR